MTREEIKTKILKTSGRIKTAGGFIWKSKDYKLQKKGATIMTENVLNTLKKKCKRKAL